MQQPLDFGYVTAPSTGFGSVTISPGGQRSGTPGVDPIPSRTLYQQAQVLVRGEAGAEFRLSFQPLGPGLRDFQTDSGSGGTLGGTGERVINVGATYDISGTSGESISSNFRVTVELAD